MKKKEDIKIDYLITQSFGIFVADGKQINLVSAEGVKKFSATFKKRS